MAPDEAGPRDASPVGRRATEPDLDPRSLAVAAALCALAFVGVTVLVASGLTGAVDAWWNRLLAGARRAPPVWAAQVLTVVGDVPLSTAFRVAGAAWLLLRRRFVSFWAWVIAATVTPILVDLVVKPLVGRERPLDFVWSANGFSFPSGHVTAAATNAALLVLLLVPARHRRAGVVAGVIWISAMALARNLLGAHWLSDVVGGILLGLSITFGAVAASFSMRAGGTEEEGGRWDARSP